MPEAPMDKDNLQMLGQNNVWTTGQVLSVQPKTESHPVDKRPNKAFRGSIGALYAGHYPTTLTLLKDVHDFVSYRR